MKTLEIGCSHEVKQTVESKDTAKSYGSGMVEVFATPAMITMMENTCLQCVQESLTKGYTTVGTAVDIRHIKATPIGHLIKCVAKLVNINGNKLTFEVEAFDEDGKIGLGIHKRYIINHDEFMKSIK